MCECVCVYNVLGRDDWEMYYVTFSDSNNNRMIKTI